MDPISFTMISNQSMSVFDANHHFYICDFGVCIFLVSDCSDNECGGCEMTDAFACISIFPDVHIHFIIEQCSEFS
jgi:hypothetical protein